MRSSILLALALFLDLYFVVSEVTAQTCSEGDCVSCKVGGKTGTRCCVNGKLSKCVPELDEPPERCGGKVCTGGKVCVNARCVCEQGFTDCGGTCRDLSS